MARREKEESAKGFNSATDSEGKRKGKRGDL